MNVLHWVLWLAAGSGFLIAIGAFMSAAREAKRQRRVACLLLAATGLLAGAKLTLSLTMKLPPAVAWTLNGAWWAFMIATWLSFRSLRTGP